VRGGAGQGEIDMHHGSLVGLARQMTLERQLDVVANNIANLNTTGYKSSSSLFEEFLVQGARDANFARADAQVHSVLDRAAFHDLG
jgi:flagellar basal-body rod protein FlgF